MSSHEESKGIPIPESPTAAEQPYTAPHTPDYGAYDDPYGYDGSQPGGAITHVPAATPALAGGGGGSTPPPSPPVDEDDDDNDGMLRMSFLEHLEELRKRIILALVGIGVAFALSLTFCNELWGLVSQPAVSALLALGFPKSEAKLSIIAPMEAFSIIWVKLPMLTSIFLSAPWILYQVWAFIAPGLYRKERRWAAPFILVSAGLFIAGGLFAYFVAFRFGLTFLLGIGRDENVRPLVSVTEYFDLFVNVVLGVALVFEMPVLIFFLTLLRIASPRFLLANTRYAILIIVLVAAIVTPTPDVFNLMLFALPMCMLFFVGVFASYLLVLNRENKRFPWRLFLLVVGVPLLLMGGGVALAVWKYGYHFITHWPFLTR